LNRLSTSYRQVVNNIPTCPHFSFCSGCEILLSEMPSLWEEALLFFRPFSIEPKLWKRNPLRWRLKAKLPVRKDASSPVIGLFKKGTHEAVSIPHCLVHHPSINEASARLLKGIQEENVSIYDEKRLLGHLRYAQMVVSRESQTVQLSLALHARDLPEDVRRLCRRLEKDLLFHSIWINFHPKASNRIFGEIWQHMAGASWLYQPFLGERVPFHPGAFSQANLEVFEDLVQTIQSWVFPGDRIVELFAGVGIIGASLLCLAKSVLLVENNPFAALSFQERLGKKPEYLLQDASEFADFSTFDLVIVDPPRKGLGPKLLQNLSSAQKLRLIYVSCGWKSFQADANALMASGWRLQKAEGFYLFPGTNHIEIAALFEKI